MIWSYTECVNQFKDHAGIQKEIEEGRLYRIEKGIYSDQEYVPDYQILSYKYPNAIFTLDIAFYFHNLTDTIPQMYHLKTGKDSPKIQDSRVIQLFDNNKYWQLGAERKEVDGGGQLLIYNQERLLIELIRYRSKIPYDLYKEVINHYRNRIHQMDMQKLDEYIRLFPKRKLVNEVLEKEIL